MVTVRARYIQSGFFFALSPWGMGPPFCVENRSPASKLKCWLPVYGCLGRAAKPVEDPNPDHTCILSMYRRNCLPEPRAA